MNDPELQEFADLWQQPDASEQAEFEALARKARQRGRLLGYGDIVLAVLVIGGTASLLAERSTVTIVAAIFLLVGTLWLNWKRRQLRQMASTLDTQDRASFIESSLRNAKANLRRVTISFALVPPFVLLVVVLKLSGRGQVGTTGILSGLLEWAQSPRGIIALGLVALLAAYVVRSRRRLRAEMRQLESLRAAYEEEAEHDGS